ncbi:anthranilate phosphoribosyltransferase [Haematospirillum jordaniae]|uniref:anthranilate phosphoribosyltransferase n=1 Tax=Haematospirillum jordaniae TaxID=1549855 RepID=UPI0014330BE5|nr:anthranilate phosphoribosyltransferase [Haematospirillum jordaniae]NKD89063.1 anthranilate phosphoribosyltransferase [Haematospirillum jordaniae]
MSGGLGKFLPRLADGEVLSSEEAAEAFDVIMSGRATPAQIGAFLMAMRLRGETVDEITAAARTMRSHAVRIQAPPGAIDIVGTGGDGSGTYNISTAAALVVAAVGVPVAKHGNRAASSRSGSADVLCALGLNLDADFTVVEKAMHTIGIGFMMAPRHHSAMQHVAPARREIGVRTIFNLLGPLTNPASADYQLMGVFDRKWLEPVAHCLGKLGLKRATVVCGHDGLDEVTTTGPTYAAEPRDGDVRCFEIVPEDAGLPRATLAELKGGAPEHNAEMIRKILGGEPGPFRNIVVLNAAAALVTAERVNTLREGAELACRAIDNGKASSILASLVRLYGSHHSVSIREVNV